MAGAVSLNDVARMLSTKGGDMSTIGGAIGCMSAMISADAREKDNTFSNDIKKLKEFVCGSGGDMSSMFQYLGGLIQEQTTQIEKLTEGDKEKKLVRNDITKTIKKATDGLEKRLDKILDSLHVIAKSQGGNIKWGNTKKAKDSVEKFKMSLSDQKKLKDSKIGQVVQMLTELKAIKLKDLVTFKPKVDALEKLTPKINSLAKNINTKNLEKVESFLEKAPKLLKDFIKVSKLAKKIDKTDFERLYKLLGIGGKKAGKNTVFGLVDSLSKIDKKKLTQAKKNADTMFGIIKDLCLGITMFVAFSPIILIGGLLIKPVTWALFGVKGKGGIIGLFKKLNKNKKDIKEANKAIMLMSLGFVTLGIGFGVLFALTKRIRFENIIMVALATTVMSGVTILMGKFKNDIKEGAMAMLYLSGGIFALGIGFGTLFGLTRHVRFDHLLIMGGATLEFTFIAVLMGKLKSEIKDGAISMLYLSAGLLTLGLGFGVLFGLTKKTDFVDLLVMGSATVAFTLISVFMGNLKDDIKDGAVAMLYLAGGLFALGLGLGVFYKMTKGIELEDVAVVAGATLGLGLVSVIMGHFKSDIKDGAVAMAEMGLGLIVLGIGLNLMFKLTKNIDLEQLMMVGVATLGLGVVTVLLGHFKSEIQDGAIAMAEMSLGIIVLGIGLGVLFALTKDVTWEQMAMVGVSIVFLGGVTVALGALNKSGLVLEGAIAMGIMGAALIPFGIAMKLIMGSVKGLKWGEFAMFAATLGVLGGAVIGLGALMCTGFGAVAWLAGIGAITTLGAALIPFGIGLNLIKKVAQGIDLKAIDNMGAATKSIFKALNDVGSGKERRNARKNAVTLKKIGKSLKSIVKSLKKFNDLAPDAVDKAMDALTRIADFFFGSKGLSSYSVNWLKRMKATAGTDTIGMIARHMGVLSKSLKTFNEVGPDSIDKAMDAIRKIAEYFFSEDSPLNKMNTGWRKRRKADVTVDAIGSISGNIWKLSDGLKKFNDVSADSIDKAMNAVNKIAEYFFSETSPLNKMNMGWRKRRKAEKAADAIGTISDSVWKLATGLKDFNEIGPSSIDKAMDAVGKVASYFFSEDSPLNKMNTGWRKRRKAEKTADSIGVIADSMYKISQALKDFNEIGSKAADTMVTSVDKIAQAVFADDTTNINASKVIAISLSLESLADGIRYFNKKTKGVDTEKMSQYIQTVNTVTSEILGSWKPEYEANAKSIENSMKSLVTSFKGGGREYVRMARVTRKLFKQLANPMLPNSSRTISRVSKLVDKVNELDKDKVGTLIDLLKNITSTKGAKGIFKLLRKQVEEAEKDDGIDKMIAKIEKVRNLLDNIGKIDENGGVGAMIQSVENTMDEFINHLKSFNETGEVDKTIKNIRKLFKCLFGKDKTPINLSKPIAVNSSLWWIGKGLKKYNKDVSKLDIDRIKSSMALTNKLTNEVLAPWKTEYLDNAISINDSMKSIVSSFDGAGMKYMTAVNTTRRLFKQMSSPVFVESGKTISRLNSFVGRVNTIEMDKVSSLTDLFKSFASIGKGGGIFSKFDKRVQQFTDACIELVNAINGNTDAINNSEEEVVVRNEFGEEETVKRKDAELMPKQMTILNISELADAIADKMNEMNVDCDANINLQINSESGNEWRITRM